MKRLVLLAFIICVALASACAAPPTISTPLGAFESSQKTLESIEDDHGNSLAAAEGNTLLVVYLTPAKDTQVTEDDVYAYFNSGTKCTIEGVSYGLECLAFEMEAGKLRYGLVFEIKDLGYENKQPNVQLNLPQSVPEKTPAPTATSAPTVAQPIPTTDAAASPTESTAASS